MSCIIRIMTSNVTIDCMGHGIWAHNELDSIILIEAGCRNVMIRDGALHGAAISVFAGEHCDALRIQGMSVSDFTNVGLLLRPSGRADLENIHFSSKCLLPRTHAAGLLRAAFVAVPGLRSSLRGGVLTMRRLRVGPLKVLVRTGRCLPVPLGLTPWPRAAEELLGACTTTIDGVNLNILDCGRCALAPRFDDSLVSLGAREALLGPLPRHNVLARTDADAQLETDVSEILGMLVESWSILHESDLELGGARSLRPASLWPSREKPKGGLTDDRVMAPLSVQYVTVSQSARPLGALVATAQGSALPVFQC